LVDGRAGPDSVSAVARLVGELSQGVRGVKKPKT